MFYTIIPLPVVYSAISPEEFTLALFFSIFIPAFISIPVRPFEYPIPMHLPIFPVAFIGSSIRPSINTSGIERIVAEVTLVEASISLGVFAFTVLHSVE